MNLFPYQNEGVDWLVPHFRAILADEPGLGKTVQVAALIDRCPGIETVLVVCPASVKSVWRKHLHFPQVVSGRTPCDIIDNQVVINYDILAAWVPVLAKIRWDLVVFDEAHYLKSVEAARSEAAFRYLMKANRVLFLTGTPMLNRPAELWPILYAIDRSVGTWEEFTAKYCGGHFDKYGVWQTGGSSNLPELYALLQNYMLRRYKRDVLTQLPPKLRQVVNTETTRWAGMREALGDGWRNELKGLKQRQKKLDSDVLAKVRRTDGLAKVSYVLDYVKFRLGSDPKVIVAAHHTDVIKALEAGLAQFGAVSLYGATPQKQRGANIEKFQTDPDCRVFIGQITAAGQGITLTAADRVIFAELSWVPGEMDQMECRHHRIGKTGTVWVDWIIAPESIDAIIAPILLSKMDKIDQAVNGQTGSEISRDVVWEAFEIFG